MPAKERLLLLELKRIDDFLETRGTTFLSGNEMTLVDCDVMPKLQHIRIAGKVNNNHFLFSKKFEKKKDLLHSVLILSFFQYFTKLI